MYQETKHFYEFGEFRLETNERILLKGNNFVPLTPKVYETLLVLVKSGGRIIDKEELLRLVWPDTFVGEVNLAKKISSLRKTLEETDSQQYIETIPRRGYRFVAEVREVWQEEPGQNPKPLEIRQGNGTAIKIPSVEDEPPEKTNFPTSVEVSADRQLFSRNGLIRTGIFVSVGLTAVLITWVMANRRPLNNTTGSLKAIPLTSYKGPENQVDFSPDGKQIAFVWRGPDDNNRDIYVKMIGAETPLRLTTDPGDDINPVWSPDGRYIAFVRQTGDSTAYYLIPSIGGAERKLTDVFPYITLGIGRSDYYSPDGKYLAIVDKDSAEAPKSIYLLSIETGEKRRVTTPPQGTNGDYYPAFSRDGKKLAFVRSTSFLATDLYTLSLRGGEPKRLTSDNLLIQGLTWSVDDREIIFASRRDGSISYLWRIPATGGTPERVNTVGGDMISPAISPHGNRLAYSQDLNDVNIWRFELGREPSPTELIASSFSDYAPDYSPDGRKIVFASTRSNSYGIWLCESDGTKPRLLYDGGPRVTGNPSWSPNGRWIVFMSRANESGKAGNPDIYILDTEGGQPRRFTNDDGEDVAPSWSRDGRSIYFSSTRTGSPQIWKAPFAGGPAVQITKQGGFEGFESPDGKYLYYTKGRSIPGIWKVPVAGGDEVLVTDHHKVGLWRCWRVVNEGIFFATDPKPAPAMLEFYSFATGQIHQITKLAKGPDRNMPGMAISPDGRHLLYVQLDLNGSDIMMVGDFH